jgi:formylglycine-generating enzyme required for sulfatase activity
MCRFARCLLLSATLIAALGAGSCATADLSTLKREPEFFYGYGKAATAEEADAVAKQDLIISAREGVEPSKAETTTFALPDLKPFKKAKADGVFSVVYRLPKSDWAGLERARLNGIRTETGKDFDALRVASGKPLVARITEAGRLLDRLSSLGLTDSLMEREGGSIPLALSIEDYCRDAVSGLLFRITPEEGFVHNGTSFRVSVADAAGVPIGGLPLAATWKTADGYSVSAKMTTGSDGTAEFAFPSDIKLQERGVTLQVTTDFAWTVSVAAGMKKVDATTETPARYRHFASERPFEADEILVAGSLFSAGAVPQDRRATKAESTRSSVVAAFRMDRYPITNRLFRMYLEDAKVPASDYPDFFDHPSYNGPDQPVIGVSWNQAVAFADWLSARLGYKKRLPTENEWEMAARGGQTVIYPWGDQSPTDGIRANYNGNKRFEGPSPVGSFGNGKNAIGIQDMAGNVWEWTSSAPDAAMGVGAVGKIVKGGSWMDGPIDLRISNRRALDPAAGYADVGFRLVREASN